MIEFQTNPEAYKHWRLEIDGPIAKLIMDVNENEGLAEGYELKLNSYDLGVDIELYDATQRLRFEHPEVKAVILTSGKERVFCAGANISMLGNSSHGHKVNFCKFTNETRNGIEDASVFSEQRYICLVNGTAAGGGYELALAADYIMLIDDGTSTVSLPEVPLLAVLPGTGGLTRVVDKRHVRKDRADFFCTLAEGIKGKRALDWKLVDELVPRSKLMETAQERALEFSQNSVRPSDGVGIKLGPLERDIVGDEIKYKTLSVELDREYALAEITILAPSKSPPTNLEGVHEQGDAFWHLALARELDDLILHLRTNESEISTWVFKATGNAEFIEAGDKLLLEHADDWLIKEITLFLKRTLKRLDVSSRSLLSFIEPGSCFTGTILEVVLSSDRSYMLDGTFEGSNVPPAKLRLTGMNLGPLPMCNGLTRIETRHLNDKKAVELLGDAKGRDLEAEEADELGLITFIPDDIDWEDEVRLAIEERASYSTDALTGMEASLRFVGPETLETKIFGRLSAWQNWIFQRPNAVGEEGALNLFGTGKQANFDKKRV
ncbi:MAG: 2,3-epoxybenzoyl-CoA dihydrolase [Pseudomonadota bacterium]|nr:2,3-epoxybenzoyl-CoA dihydrolase [Pseudomonadota bacterium]